MMILRIKGKLFKNARKFFLKPINSLITSSKPLNRCSFPQRISHISYNFHENRNFGQTHLHSSNMNFRDYRHINSGKT